MKRFEQPQPRALPNYEWHPERSEDEEYRGYRLRRDDNSNLYRISKDDGTPVPNELSTMYTRKLLAQKAVDDFIEADIRQQDEAKALAEKEKLENEQRNNRSGQ
jgi:hypothetical protein